MAADLKPAGRETPDRLVALLAEKDFDGVLAMCRPDLSIDMGVGVFTGDQCRMVIEHSHVVIPGRHHGDRPRWETKELDGEWIAIGYRILEGFEGLNEVWRFGMADDAIAQIRLYCFNHPFIDEVGAKLRLPVIQRPPPA